MTSTDRSTVTIMPLGDSITQGFRSTGTGGYRAPLWKRLQERGLPILYVGSLRDGPADLPAPMHEGHYGWTIAQLADKVVPWLEYYQPDVVLLHAGTNDILQGQSVEVICRRLQHLIGQIVSCLPASLLLVAQITPLGYMTINERIQKLNHHIPELVRHLSYAHTVDIYHAVSMDRIVDKIHTDDAGYALMAEAWFESLLVHLDITQHYPFPPSVLA